MAIILSFPAAAQVPASRLVTQPVDNTSLATLPGSVHPLAQPGYDQGAVNESVPADRLLLLLNRPPDREAAFQQLLKDQQTPGSPNYHHWLTPEEIGSRFGPADGDMDAVVEWLSEGGFNVSRVSKAKRFVEFSGTVGQLNNAFHTQIREYRVNGELHHANATAIRIPKALAGIVAGLSPLHDFRPTTQFLEAGKGHYDAGARRFIPEFNLPSSWSPLLYGVAPADFYTQYDLNSVYSANVTGSGVTIGIIDESNIDLSLVSAYRNVFGVAANPVQVVLDGGDPGSTSSYVETYLDVELAGAVAPAATVDLYLSAGSPYQDPLELAALRAVEDDQADVLSVSWGAGEQELGTSGNQFWNAIWEQAAAQGQTVLVAAGDYGQIPDDNYLVEGSLAGPAVNGLASTPWNVAVGGTDFYYSDYASGAPSASTFWNATNNPTTKGSLIAPITEQVWDDAYGLDAISDGVGRGEVYAAGGGASNCSTVNAITGGCASGYTKPSWQSGPGVPADGARDLPDVSLFASNGANYSGYVICDSEGECAPDASGNFGFDIVGGTSASAQAMAGIMALVVQKYGRQGQADTVLYPLSQQKPSSFHDITLGGNWDVCVQSDADCTLNGAGVGVDEGESTVYSAATGFDLASGWGSVDGANLVNNWNSITFQSTNTSLEVSPTSVTHGQNVTLSTSVTPASGSGTPTGAVSILTNSTLPSSESQTAILLNGGEGSTTVNDLPGGTYELTAHYGGDGVYAASASSSQTLTVMPEQSTLALKILGANNAPVSDLSYGLPVYLSAQPVGANLLAGQSNGAATGSVAFTLDSATASIPLNVGGIASWTTPVLSVGAHTASATYSGDASFLTSSAAAVSFSVAKGYPAMTLNVLAPLSSSSGDWVVNAGGSINLAAEVGPEVGILSGEVAPPGVAGPTGTVTICLNTTNLVFPSCTKPSYTQTVPLVSPNGLYSLYSEAAATFTNLAAGEYYPQLAYNGDANWQSSGVNYLNFISVEAATPETASTTTLSVSPDSISGTQEAQLTATVTGSNGVAPTGWVYYYDNDVLLAEEFLGSSAGATSTSSLSAGPTGFWNNGPNQIVAIYYGDTNYAGSTSNSVSLTVSQTVGGFMVVPAVPQITVPSGSSGTIALNLTSVNNFNGTLALTCAPSSSQLTCSISPSSPALSTTASATLTISATAPAATAMRGTGPGRGFRFGAGTAFALGFVLILPWSRRRGIRIGTWMALLTVVLTVSFLAACGGGGSTSTGHSNQTVVDTPAGTYSVLVTGTANGIVHSALVNVIVQ